MKNKLICIALVLLVSLVAGISPACGITKTTSQSGITTTSQSGITTTTGQTGTIPTPNTTAAGGQTPAITSAGATTTGAALPGGIPNIADIHSLSSYRYTIMTKLKEGPGAGSMDYMKYEWVKAQKAEHAWLEDDGGQVTEIYITIGDRAWMWMPMLGWIEQPPQPTSTSELSSDLAAQLKQAQQDMEHSKMHFDKKGTETVNNVKCTKYEFDYYLTTEMPNMVTGGTTKTVMHSTGNMWIADQAGLPTVVIKSVSTTEIDSGGEKMVMESEQNLTDIGSAISIKAPDGVQIPTGPGLPNTTATTRPATTTSANTTPRTTTGAASTPPVTGTLLFGDDFQGAWNSRWEWTDPGDDVDFSFTAHAGFLRLTVPEDNDLAAAVNYDAPRLLVPQTGNFTLETLIEFDPKEIYQGAGLLVWQDENTFLRLEFGFGGMGGDDKNVVFVKQDDGVLSLVDSIDLPESTKRIELRLQRKGDDFTAWYRLAGGTWQEIGSIEFDLKATVEVGIAQITQYTPTEIFADFDYFRMYAT